MYRMEKETIEHVRDCEVIGLEKSKREKLQNDRPDGQDWLMRV